MPGSFEVLQEIRPLNATVQVAQIIGIIIPLIGIIVLLRKEQHRSAVYLMLANIACMIVNSGYFLILNSKGFEEAILVFKMEYLGNILFYIFFLIFLCSYLKIRMPKVVCAFWIVFESFEICMLWNDNYNAMFRDIEFRQQKQAGVNYLQIEASWITNVRYGVIGVALFFVFVYTVYQLIRLRKFAVRHTLMRLLVAELIVIVSLVLAQFYHLADNITPICTSMAVFIISLGVVSGEIFNVTDMGREWVFENIEHAVLILDTAYGYLDANACAKNVFPELVKVHENWKVPKRIIQIFEDEKEEFWIDERHYQRTIIPLKQNKDTVGYSLILTDDTGQYTLMEELVEAREKAESANRAKTAFLSNMSHEIRTPMNAIVGMTEILMREEMPDEQNGYLQNIKNSGAALLSIINDILDFSKIESGKLTVVEDNYEPMSLLNDLGMIFLNRIGDKPIDLLFDVDEKLPVELYGDSLRLRQIIINIMNNAIKFTEEGYVRLTFGVEEVESGQIVLHVSVKDTGQGIKEEDLGRIFESFQQVNTRKNHEKEGTGLGLAITKQLVELMGGSISVHSTYGEGSEFYFTLPQKVVNAKRAALIKTDKINAGTTLVCGDIASVYVRDELKKLVETYGMQYIDYQTALEQGQRVDYLFVDYDADPEKRKKILKNPEDKKAFCGLCNPMQESARKGQCTFANKPLYSLNFCRFINREMQEVFAETEDYLNFIAPDANILIVDDTEMNLKVALGLLRPLQMHIDTVNGGRTAIRMVQEKRYDLIFMDHMMPDMDGIETVQKLRSLPDEYFKQVPIIALTANAVVGAKEMFLAAGMNDLVGKPMDMKEVCGKIKKWLPKEKIQKKQPLVKRDEDMSDLPEIKGIDSAVGVKNSGSLELWISLLGDFYKMIDNKAEKLEQCLREEAIRDYTIEVHALKNTARMIGAVELSEMFYRMEQLGNASDREMIAVENPKLLEFYRSYKPILEPFAKQEKREQQSVAKEKLIEILEQLRMAIDTFDLDTADAALRELEGYEMPECCAGGMQKLQEYMADVAMEEVLATTSEMISKLQTMYRKEEWKKHV